MHVLAGPYLAAALLLVVAGSSKLRDPLPLVRALRSVRLPASSRAVRVVAAAEVLLGLTAAVGGRAPAVLVALSYAAFSVFVLVARARGGVLASCGCFGRADTPPTTSHLVVTAGFATVAGMVALRPLAPLTVGPAAAALLLAAVAVAVPAYLVLALLPGLRVAR